MQKSNTRVLIIGHNVLDERTAFGKTLISFFKDWGKDSLAELYFHSEVPTSKVCGNYFRITDTDVFNNVVKRCKLTGKSFGIADIDATRTTSRTDTGIKNKIYSFGRKRSSLIFIARNFIWKHSRWFSDELKKWIADFKPEVIFFAAGDYAFAYDITYKIAEEFNIPVVMYCCDDYYINRVNPRSLLSKTVYKRLMKSVNRCAEKTSAVITICDKMAEAYKKLFDKPIYTVYTGYSAAGVSCDNKTKSVVYLGNLGFNRYEPLTEIGRALKTISAERGEEYTLDVYSSENRRKVLKHLNLKNGIVFHGAVGADEVKKIIADGLLVLHVESFRKKNVYKVAYSMSTKIADILAAGTCIFAYGPKNIASIEYLAENSAAITATDKTDLKERLESALFSEELRERTIENAKALAEKNHNADMVSQKIEEIILLGKIDRVKYENFTNQRSV
ncbi:MAG: hypothetical protein IJQ07_06420 [Clostridia bacterium]|nr:hypothetical protein [Clostridia bacterium]